MSRPPFCQHRRTVAANIPSSASTHVNTADCDRRSNSSASLRIVLLVALKAAESCTHSDTKHYWYWATYGLEIRVFKWRPYESMSYAKRLSSVWITSKPTVNKLFSMGATQTTSCGKFLQAHTICLLEIRVSAEQKGMWKLIVCYQNQFHLLAMHVIKICQKYIWATATQLESVDCWRISVCIYVCTLREWNERHNGWKINLTSNYLNT